MSESKENGHFWALARSAGYLVGKGVTYGAPFIPPNAVQPNVYSIVVGPSPMAGLHAADQTLSSFADASLDHILVTPVVEALLAPLSLLREAATKLKVGGHIIVYITPSNSNPGSTPISEQEVRDTLSASAHWRVKDEHWENGRYLLILKKVEGRRGIDPLVGRSERKRVCIARYGALGDAIIMTPLIRQLALDGYEVTLNISSYCRPVFANNPHIHNVIIQEKDLIPNHLLGRYWNFWESQYDKYINLSESIEGDLLMVEGRPPYFTSKAWRNAQTAHNYTDYTLRRGGYPHAVGERSELFFTRAEERAAERFFSPLRSAGRWVVIWALNGSSHHKVYPLLEATLTEWFRLHPDCVVVTTGDYTAKLLEFDHPQLIPRAGEWSLRESLIATKYAHLVVGPETMMTNAAGCFPTPKITFLSHSSHENLCKHWENDYCLAPSLEVAPCYPCNQLHYSRESCPIGEIKDSVSGEVLGSSPICTLAISPERVLARLEEVYQTHDTKTIASSI